MSGRELIQGAAPGLDCGIIVIDFEALTPRGRPMQPVEVAVLALRHHEGIWREQARSSTLIRPPDDIPVTARFTSLTKITAAMLAPERDAAVVLGELDRRLSVPPYRLVAHNAATEAALIRGQAEHCPNLAGTGLIDTLAMARTAIPHLVSHKLDSLVEHYRLAPHPDRHRAMADVELTAEIFIRLLADGVSAGYWQDLATLDAAAGRAPARVPARRTPAPWQAQVPAP
jgi:DNA polymerase-3 subunit epsilon